MFKQTEVENGITIIQLINCTPADMIMHKKNTVCTLTTKFTIPKSISTSIKNCVFACVLLSPICVSRLPISIYFGEHLLRENPVSSSALHVCDLVCMFLYIQTETHTLVGVTPFRSFQRVVRTQYSEHIRTCTMQMLCLRRYGVANVCVCQVVLVVLAHRDKNLINYKQNASISSMMSVVVYFVGNLVLKESSKICFTINIIIILCKR